jgi:DNA-binding CsgD family transcriptional regulator
MDAAQRQRYQAAYDSISRLSEHVATVDDPFGEVSRRLRKVIAFRTGGWLRLDPATFLPMPGLLLQARHDRARALIRNEYFEPDVLKFRDLARAPVPAGTLWRATDGEPERSTRYRTIQAGMGYGDELRAVFRCGDSAWGAVCIARSADDPPFSADDVAFVARVSAPVGRMLRLSHLLAGDLPAGPAPPGALILGEDDSVISRTGAARHWLDQLPPEQARGLELPMSVLCAASQARTAGTSSGRVRTADGRWLRLHAERLAPPGGGAGDGDVGGGPGPAAGLGPGAGKTVVIIEPAGAAELSPLVLDLHGLTEREREIVQFLLRGLPTTEIARRLFISRHTLGDHIKAIFAKLGVSSRPELTALLLDRAHAGLAAKARRSTGGPGCPAWPGSRRRAGSAGWWPRPGRLR